MKRFGWMALPLLLAGACSDELPTSAERGPVLQPAVTVVGADVLYTADANFDQGTLVNVNHDPPGNDQLQLNRASGTFPFIWVALSQRCTIAKVNTSTGAIIGEYRTVADNVGCAESSRTTVSLDGGVWVGHRGGGGVTHVGLVELNQCVDRNGNSVIETSTGYGDVKAWPGSASDVNAAADECILHHVDTDAAPISFADTRHMSIDANNKLWIGDYAGGHRFIRVDGATGVVETAPRAFACGGYGGLIDKNGVIWSANGGGSGLLRWDPNAPDVAGVNPRCIPITNYGLAADANGNIFATDLGAFVRKISNDGNTVLGPFTHGNSNSQGLAVDGNGDVWVSSSLFCSFNCSIGHLKNDGTFVGTVANPSGGGSTGVAVDASGKIWTANRNSHTATRIDPTGGAIGGANTPIGAVDLVVNFPSGPGGRPLPYPYNYSDMTGAQLLNTTAPQGSWTINQDGGAAGTDWGTITWNTEAQGSEPAGTQILVEARAADSEAALGSETYVAVSNGVEFDLTGQFIQVRVTMKAASDGTSPVLSDIRIASKSTALQVAIDVRPGKTDNWILPLRGYYVPVAILGAAGFDAPNVVDRWSLTFGKTGNEKTLSFPGYVPKCVVEDVNGDGYKDLICEFNTFKTNLQPGDTEAVLKGKTFTDVPFEARDVVRVFL